jgi:hypothetical protein
MSVTHPCVGTLTRDDDHSTQRHSYKLPLVGRCLTALLASGGRSYHPWIEHYKFSHSFVGLVIRAHLSRRDPTPTPSRHPIICSRRFPIGSSAATAEKATHKDSAPQPGHALEENHSIRHMIREGPLSQETLSPSATNCWGRQVAQTHTRIVTAGIGNRR